MNERKKIIWRAYRIDGERDLERALADYERLTGEKPTVLRIGEHPMEHVLRLAERSGLEIVRSKGVLPWDVWLTHEREEPHPQLSLFGETEQA